MFCHNCGVALKDGATFCTHCGTPVVTKPVSPPISNISNPRSSSYIARTIRSKSLRRLYLGVILAATGIAILLSQQNYIANLLSGSRQIDAVTLEQELVIGHIKDINVTLPLASGDVYTAGYTAITQTIDQDSNQVESTTTDGEYYLTTVGQHILVLEGVPGQLPSGTFSGVVVPLDPILQPQLTSDFNNNPDLKALSSSILPYMLSNEGMFELDGFWFSLVGLLVLCWGIIVIIRRAIDIDDTNHYIYTVATAAGYNDIDQLSGEFISANHAGLTRIGNYSMSNKFVFRDSVFTFTILPLSQMYWAYKKVIYRRIYFVPAGKTYAIVLRFKPKGVAQVAESERKVNEHLVLLMSLCPKATVGYTKH